MFRGEVDPEELLLTMSSQAHQAKPRATLIIASRVELNWTNLPACACLVQLLGGGSFTTYTGVD